MKEMNPQEFVTQAETGIEQGWFLLNNAEVQPAWRTGENLVGKILDSMEKHETSVPELYRLLALACHLAGYAGSMVVQSGNIPGVLDYFKLMRRTARRLNDDALSVVAWTYQGDLYRRVGKFTQATRCLQLAYDRPVQDQGIHGNCAQLRGRLFSQRHDEENFARMMSEAEQIAQAIGFSMHGQFSLGTVYLDCCIHYSQKGETNKALEYLVQAEETLPKEPHWNILTTATRGLLLGESDYFEQERPSIMHAIKLVRKHGYESFVDQFSALHSRLAWKAIKLNRASSCLGGALYGPLVASE